jgi:hypothetical protein
MQEREILEIQDARSESGLVGRRWIRKTIRREAKPILTHEVGDYGRIRAH